MTQEKSVLQRQSELLDELPRRVEALLWKYKDRFQLDELRGKQAPPGDAEDSEVTPPYGTAEWFERRR